MDKQEYREQLTEFYSNLEEVWPKDDKWHVYTHSTISDFVKRHIEKKKGFEKLKILNLSFSALESGECRADSIFR